MLQLLFPKKCTDVLCRILFFSRFIEDLQKLVVKEYYEVEIEMNIK